MQSQPSTPHSSHWAPPRAPLSPHRLAKLANALGISTPLPAMTSSSFSHTHLPSSNTDHHWTPSTSPSQSKYLLHVIPPTHLPHELVSTELAPPPSTASGYHTHFRRGTLVALQSTLQSQLVLIAREYALPSTIGVVLYLVTTSPQSGRNSPIPFSSPTLGGGEAGPRLSEEVWKHIWTRVLRAERESVAPLSQSLAPSPSGPGLNAENSGLSQFLRPLVTPTRTEQPRPLAYPLTPSSTSTASSVSDVRSADKSADASSPVTPGTSPSSDHAHSGIELPGLNSSSIIPILAKVEFDIDKRKATWYEPWVRSRRVKRPDSRSTHHSDSQPRTLDSSSSTDEKRAPYDLKLVKRMQKPAFLRSQDDSDGEEQLDNETYAPLSESPDTDADDADECTTFTERDPLGDVFGTDAQTWTEIHADSDGIRRRNDNPNVVELALDPVSLATVPEQSQEEDGEAEAEDVDEVRDIIQRISRPPLSVAIPEPIESKRKSTLSTAGKRPMPPPLVLVPKSPTADLIEGTPDAVDFRDKEGSSLELEQEYQRSRSPGEEKRVCTVFEDLDLGLDLGDDNEEYDENDPNDQRRSQYLMKAKLDEIERTLAQFSPQRFQTAKPDVDAKMTHRHNLSTASHSRAAASSNTSSSPLPNVWPSVPYASVTKTVNGSPPRPTNLTPSPPRLALNGVSTGAPKAFMAASASISPSTLPTESQLRRRELDQSMYSTAISPSHQMNFASDSPIPLPADPFSRHPSIYEVDAAPVQSYWDPTAHTLSPEPLSSRPSMSSIDDGSGALPSATPSSRFSADSSATVDLTDKTTKPTAPLVSVKGFTKLWRRSKSSSSALPPQTPIGTSFQFSNSPLPSTPTDPYTSSAFPRGLNGKLHVDQSPSDQDWPRLPYPSRPSLSGSRPNSPAVHLNTPPQDRPGIRKSILKSWKSVAGTGSQQTNGSEPRKSTDRIISHDTIKPRRPSILDGGIPPNPQLPEYYLPSKHVRTGSNFLERRKSGARSKMGSGHHYSSGSQDLLSPMPPVRSSVVMQFAASASSSQSHLSAPSRESEDLETASQFELVSPPKVHPNLTYPYMALDHE